MDFLQQGRELKGRYTIESAPRVSEDSATVTYRARDNQTQERVAIETPNPGIHDPGKLAKIQSRFAQEAQKLTMCSNHTHIIDVRGILFQEEGLWCLPLEYLAGGTLADLEEVCLEESKALEYVRQIGEALTVVHQCDLVHGDVRPANMRLRAASNEAVLTEFSLTRQVGNSATSRTMPARWREYAPLEAIAGAPTPRSDLYMLGGTLYYLLTGRVPVGAMERHEGAKLDFTRVTDGEPLSRQLEKAIASAMKLEEDKRPDSVGVWLVTLGFDVSPETGTVHKLSKEELSYEETKLKLEQQKLASKNQWLVVIVTVLGIVGGVMGIVKLVYELQPKPPQIQEEAK
ncbi:MAG: serine/threonine protein kinase [Geitlerinemataceae cyanobacterium]|mgnify:CR=1 FL=1